MPAKPLPQYIVRPDYPTATRAPTASDDATTGCEPGSRWLWGARAWLCVSNAPGAAVWHELTAVTTLQAALADLTGRVVVLEGQIKLKKDK
jgi:hypothetical protein